MWILHMCGVHCVGIYRCVGIPGWAGMGTHMWVQTYMYQHMHVEAKEVLGVAPRGSSTFCLRRISLA